MSFFMCPLVMCGYVFRGAEAAAIEQLGICTRCQGVFREDAPDHIKGQLRVTLQHVPSGVSR